MAFDIRQKKALKAKLRFANVKTRINNGATIHYIEGWQAIAEANRIFGPDNWDRETGTPNCIWSEHVRGKVSCLYSSKVRITVRAGNTTIVREGVGTGIGRATLADSAHDIAMKAAETDATKRALATFGNPFGLALYDKRLNQVTRPAKKETPGQRNKQEAIKLNFELFDSGGHKRELASSTEFLQAVEKSLLKLQTLEALYTFWEGNIESFTAVLDRDPEHGRSVIDVVIAKLKTHARVLGTGPSTTDGQLSNANSVPKRQRSRKVLADNGNRKTGRAPIAKERRVRDAEHLKFVARHPCLVCGRRPAQAHHVRFAQPSAMAMKVSDEYAVPLCAGHHDSVHRTGDERAWWSARKIDPLAIALKLWSFPDKSGDAPKFPSETALEDPGDTGTSSIKRKN